MYTHRYIYIYINTCIYICTISIYIHIYIYGMNLHTWNYMNVLLYQKKHLRQFHSQIASVWKHARYNWWRQTNSNFSEVGTKILRVSHLSNVSCTKFQVKIAFARAKTLLYHQPLGNPCYCKKVFSSVVYKDIWCCQDERSRYAFSDFFLLCCTIAKKCL